MVKNLFDGNNQVVGTYVEESKFKHVLKSRPVDFIINHHPILLIALGDTLWQICAQWLDPLCEGHIIRKEGMPAVDALAMVYPLLIGLAIWGLAHGITRMKVARGQFEQRVSTVDDDELPETKSQKPKQPYFSPDFHLGLLAFLGIAGWTAGYYLANTDRVGLIGEDWSPDVCDTGDWANMLAVGSIVGAASGLVVALYYLAKGPDQDKKLNRQGQALTFLSHFAFTFGAGMIWYLSFCSSGFGMGANVGGNEHAWSQVSRGLFAPLFTGLGTAAMLAADAKVTPCIVKKYS